MRDQETLDAASREVDEMEDEHRGSLAPFDYLNRKVLDGTITRLLVIAAPRTLGALRKQYHAHLTASLLGEIPKDLTGHSLQEVETAILAA